MTWMNRFMSSRMTGYIRTVPVMVGPVAVVALLAEVVGTGDGA